MFKVVDIDQADKLDITLKTQCTPNCRIGGKPFLAELELTYRPRKECAEFVSLEAWVQTFSALDLTIEELCNYIFDGMLHTLEPELLSVKVSATTEVHGPVVVQRKETFIT